MNRIAVFGSKESNYTKLSPPEMFRHIRGIQSIRGERFAGIILFGSPYEWSNDVHNAFKELLMRQPELFKNVKRQ